MLLILTNRFNIFEENTIFKPRVFEFPGPIINNITFQHQGVTIISIDFQMIRFLMNFKFFRVNRQIYLQNIL